MSRFVEPLSGSFSVKKYPIDRYVHSTISSRNTPIGTVDQNVITLSLTSKYKKIRIHSVKEMASGKSERDISSMDSSDK